MKLIIAVLSLFVASAFAQTQKSPGLITGTGAPSAALCKVLGQMYFQTDATAGSNLFGCTTLATTWTLLGGGSAPTPDGYGPYASRPATCPVGYRYTASDSVLVSLCTSSNTYTDTAFGVSVVPPVYATFSNQNAPTTANGTGGVMFFENGYQGGNDLWQTLYKAIPAAPFTWEVGFYTNFTGQNYQRVGLVLTDSNALRTYGIGYENGITIAGANWTNSSNISSGLFNEQFSNPQWIFFKFVDDNTNWSVYVSKDRQTWLRITNPVPRNTFVTATRIGIGANHNNTQQTLPVTVFHWTTY